MAEQTTSTNLKLMLGEDDFGGQMTVHLDSFLLFDNAFNA